MLLYQKNGLNISTKRCDVIWYMVFANICVCKTLYVLVLILLVAGDIRPRPRWERQAVSFNQHIDLRLIRNSRERFYSQICTPGGKQVAHKLLPDTREIIVGQAVKDETAVGEDIWNLGGRDLSCRYCSCAPTISIAMLITNWLPDELRNFRPSIPLATNAKRPLGWNGSSLRWWRKFVTILERTVQDLVVLKTSATILRQKYLPQLESYSQKFLALPAKVEWCFKYSMLGRK